MASSHNARIRARIPKSLSVNSLDFMTVATTLPSLLSESVTLSSLSSGSSDVPPIFYSRKPPSFRMVGLGDHLKLFSSAIDNPFKDDAVVITSPTGPRLKSMLKECLSINKWAQNSAGWRAPGHIPWEREEDSRFRCWMPEGPAMVPICLSADLALDDTSKVPKLASRRTRSSIELSKISRDLDVDISSYAAPDSMDDDLIKMMLDLKSMRSYFQESADSSTPSPSTSSSQDLFLEKSSLPFLVVSNSEFTFPLSLDSSLSLSRSMTIASRRGKVAPPSLVLKKEISSDIPYPGIPTAFLGSPSRYESVFEAKNQENKSDLRLEDMINNLRLQCSTMALRTPLMDVDDRSWNSRSYLDSSKQDQKPAERQVSDTKPSDGDEWAFAESLVMEPLPQLPIKAAMSAYTHRRRVPPIYCPSQDQTNATLQDIMLPTGVKKVLGTKEPDDSGNLSTCASRLSHNPLPDTKVSSRPLPLRSAMVKHTASRPRKSLKCVRFILKQQDIEPKERLVMAASKQVKRNIEVGTPKAQLHSLPKSSAIKPISAPLSSAPTQKPKPSIAIKRSPSAWSPTNGRVRAATISSPLRHSVIKKPLVEPEEPKPVIEDGLQSSRRSVQSLGRQSFSRIMKTPMFGGMRESASLKRATISSMMSLSSEVAIDENAVRRDSMTESLRKKSRMPVPLRNILTRFK